MDILDRLRIEASREPHEPIWHDAISEIERLRADERRMDWLADRDNHIASLRLPFEFVHAGNGNTRAAIDATMRAVEADTQKRQILSKGRYDI